MKNPIEIANKLLESKYKLTKEDIHTMGIFGSRVYKTDNHQSDYDYIVINTGSINNQEIKHPIVNLHIYTLEHFTEQLQEHKIQFLEIYFNEKLDIPFTINLQKLRHEISSKSNNSWAKCHKKLTVEEDEYYIGIKSLFHSIRIIDFGIQMASKGEIYDYSSMNWLWEELQSQYWTWEELKEKYKPLYNKKMSEFRVLAPKEVKPKNTNKKKKSQKI